MNRRGFLGLLSKLAAVGSALGVAPGLLVPLAKLAPDPEPEPAAKVLSQEEWAALMDAKPSFALAS